MGLFGKKKSRQVVVDEPLPVWNDALWRSHLRSCAVGTEHHLGIYSEAIKKERKETARLYRNDNHLACRKTAANALSNTRIVTALNALSPICNALHRRAESLAGYTALSQVQEPARSGIVTIIFASAHLNMNYLSDTVDFLREQFSSIHIDQVQAADGPLATLINPTVRNCIDIKLPTRHDVDKEIASSVKEFLGIEIDPQNYHATTVEQYGMATHQPGGMITDTQMRSVSERTMNNTRRIANENISTQYDSSIIANENESLPAPTSNRLPLSDLTSQEALQLSQTTPLSLRSSEIGTAMSPQLNQSNLRNEMGIDNNMKNTISKPIQVMNIPSNNEKYVESNGVEKRNGNHVSTASALEESRKARNSLAASLESASIKRGRSGEFMIQDELRPSISGGLRVGEGLNIGDGILQAQVAARELDQQHARALNRRASHPVFDENVPQHVREFEDSDGMLLKRYHHLTMVLAM